MTERLVAARRGFCLCFLWEQGEQNTHQRLSLTCSASEPSLEVFDIVKREKHETCSRCSRVWGQPACICSSNPQGFPSPRGARVRIRRKSGRAQSHAAEHSLSKSNALTKRSSFAGAATGSDLAPAISDSTLLCNVRKPRITHSAE